MKRPMGLVVAALLLAACSPDSGNVIEKRYEEAHTETYATTYSCGKSMCHGVGTRYIGECYRLVLDTGSVCVKSEEYAATEIGQAWHKGDFEDER